MKKFIELTAIDGIKVHINVDHIGDFSPSRSKDRAGTTNVGVTTHNNGGFYVRETPEQILNLINN